jgi:hypothetical protein
MKAWRILMGKLPEKRPLGREDQIWKYDIKMILDEIGFRNVNSMEMTRDPVYWWVFC